MTKNNLLILRNKTSIGNTKEFFSNNNIDCFYQEISISEDITVDLTNEDIDIILVTSQNALNTLQANIDKIDFKKIYCLNSNISKKLKVKALVDLNWNNTKELAEYIINNEKTNQKIVHLCADNANKLFYKDLENSGFKIKSINAYKTTFVDDFSSEVLENLKTNKIKNIMLFSKASTNAFKNILTKNG